MGRCRRCGFVGERPECFCDDDAERDTACHQCWGRGTVVIEGKRVPCTCQWVKT